MLRSVKRSLAGDLRSQMRARKSRNTYHEEILRKAGIYGLKLLLTLIH